ncbi:hypothetical protein CRUP_007019 [Coryphaenoides rupestris]|nr:hypothetical protein CRUP_007019 [Coryphaenoides rupestris]
MATVVVEAMEALVVVMEEGEGLQTEEEDEEEDVCPFGPGAGWVVVVGGGAGPTGSTTMSKSDTFHVVGGFRTPPLSTPVVVAGVRGHGGVSTPTLLLLLLSGHRDLDVGPHGGHAPQGAQRRLGSLMRLSISDTSMLRLLSRSFCCCSLLFCSWFSLLRICRTTSTWPRMARIFFSLASWFSTRSLRRCSFSPSDTDCCCRDSCCFR